MLGIAVFHALRDAVAACGDGWAVPRLDAPATAGTGADGDRNAARGPRRRASAEAAD